MEKSLADDDDGKHRSTINKSKMGGALDGQVDNEPNDDMACTVNLKCAPGSSKDTRIGPTSVLPPLEDAPQVGTDRRLKISTRKKAKKRSNTGVRDEEPFTKAILRDRDGKGGADVRVAIDRADKHDIGTPSTSPMNDGAAVDMPEGEVSTPTDHSTSFTGLPSVERYGVAEAIMGADLICVCIYTHTYIYIYIYIGICLRFLCDISRYSWSLLVRRLRRNRSGAYGA